jgi:hypothetical protein
LKAKSTCILLLSILGIIFFALHYKYFPVGADYHYSFRPAVVGWVEGQRMYAPPYHGAYNPPWIYLSMVPLSWLGYKGFLSALALLTFAVMIGAWQVFNRKLRGFMRPLSLAICIMNLHVFDLFFRGQVDGYILFGVLLLYLGVRRPNPDWVGAGWVFAITRPTGNILLILYTVWLTYRQGYLLRALVIPGVVFAASLILFDPGWIERYFVMLREAPPFVVPWYTTLWRVAEYLHLSPLIASMLALATVVTSVWVVWRKRPDLHSAFAFLLTGSLLIAPYALSYHYVVMIFVAVPLLLLWRASLALPIYLLTLTPMLRAVFGIEISWIDIGLPITIWLLLLYRLSQQPSLAAIPSTQLKTS